MEIRLLTNPTEVGKIYDFVKQYPLNYPNYLSWLEKCKVQLERGEKEAIYALDNDLVVGSIIFQPHREQQSAIEIKNFRVAEQYCRLGVGSTLESRLCSYARFNGFDTLITDTHQDNAAMIGFLIKRGYNLEGVEELYQAGVVEAILVKNLGPRRISF